VINRVRIGRHELRAFDGLWFVWTEGVGYWAFHLTYEHAVTTAQSVQ